MFDESVVIGAALAAVFIVILLGCTLVRHEWYNFHVKAASKYAKYLKDMPACACAGTSARPGGRITREQCEFKNTPEWMNCHFGRWGIPQEVAGLWTLADYFEFGKPHTHLADYVQAKIDSMDTLAELTGIMGGFAIASISVGVDDYDPPDAWVIMIAIAASLLTSATLILATMQRVLQRELAHDTYLVSSGLLNIRIVIDDGFNGTEAANAANAANDNVTEAANAYVKLQCAAYIEAHNAQKCDDAATAAATYIAAQKAQKAVAAAAAAVTAVTYEEMKFCKGMGATMLLRRMRGKSYIKSSPQPDYLTNHQSYKGFTSRKFPSRKRWWNRGFYGLDLLLVSHSFFILGMVAFIAAATIQLQSKVEPDLSWQQICVAVFMGLPTAVAAMFADQQEYAGLKELYLRAKLKLFPVP